MKIGKPDVLGRFRLCLWRRGRDSNPRYPFGVHTLSRRAPSTARSPLLCRGRILLHSTFPGFMIPSGSRARLIARIRSISTADL